MALALVLKGYALGRLVPERQVPSSSDPAPLPTGSIPTVDFPGSDISGLPRYPGSGRVDFARKAAGDLLITDIEYLTSAPVQEVQEFYRSGFRSGGWLVADVALVRGEWSFLLIKGRAEMCFEIAQRGNYTEVEIELSEPSPVPRPVPTSELIDGGAGGGQPGGGGGDDGSGGHGGVGDDNTRTDGDNSGAPGNGGDGNGEDSGGDDGA